MLGLKLNYVSKKGHWTNAVKSGVMTQKTINSVHNKHLTREGE